MAIDGVLQVYGAAFLLLGLAILIYVRRDSDLLLARTIWILAAFCFFRGTKEWIAEWMLVHGATAALNILSLAMLLASAVLLLEFGRQTIRITVPALIERSPGWGRRLTWPIIHIPIAGGILFAGLSRGNPWLNLNIWVRYLAVFPGAFLTGVSLLLYFRTEKARLAPLKIKLYFVLAALSFIAYSVLSGLVVPAGAFFPANLLNYDTFHRLVHIPVQDLRAGIAIVAVFAVARILRIFRWEADQRLRDALEAAKLSTEKFQHLAEATSDWVWETDSNGVYTYVNPKVKDVLDYEPAEILGKTPFDLMPAAEAQRIKSRFTELAALRQPFTRLEYSNRHKGGHWVVLESNGVPTFDPAGKLNGYRGVNRDITARKHADEALRNSQASLAAAQRIAHIGSWEWDVVHNKLDWSDEIYRIFGLSVQQFDASYEAFIDRVHPEDRSAVQRAVDDALRNRTPYDIEHRIVHFDGTERIVHERGEVMYDPSGTTPTRMIGTLQDITEQKTAEIQLDRFTHYDALTGLSNRLLFEDRLNRTLARSRRHEQQFALLYINLDNLKSINDTLGHASGDLLLQMIARRLLAGTREEDTLARLGGDEFVLIQEGTHRPEDTITLAQKLLYGIGESFTLNSQDVTITASIGISLYARDGADVGTLLKNAAAAMHKAKTQGRNQYQFYSQEINATWMERLSLENELRHAVKHHELFLHYQPQVDLKSGHIVGVEALLRWQHPRLGVISPSKFIPIAEDIGLIGAIGEWVLQTACHRAKAWQNAGLPPIRMAVNVSGHQISQDHVVEKVRAALDASALAPSLLELEVTESVVMKDAAQAISTLKTLKALGVMLSIDDFGTGYSSLSYLKRFPIDKIKIDKSFVDGLPDDGDDAAIAKAIIVLSHSLMHTVIAEGVETPQQLDFLRANGCDEIQGFLFSKPLPEHELVLLLGR